MSAAKRATLLLLLLAAIGANASHDHNGCHGLNTPLSKTDLHEVFGDWVLVWSVADYRRGRDLLPKLISSHVELRLLPDDHTVMFNERNLFVDESCTKHFINMSTSDSDNHSLHNIAAMLETDGVVSHNNEEGHTDFYKSCSDCLLMVYTSAEGRYLLNYRREGHHQDVEVLKAALSDHQRLAESLGFPLDKPFSYDGAADFCHKKSSAVEESGCDAQRASTYQTCSAP
ncbi:saxitoxin and tetrodotoxin-binding protein 1-like [Plectropomus leopardus]|uniref:saxitoxin and tetrodotoxin-binding protein 1-like n=1 Tax=Plectropomus leopardus TaxID=160734 RepID=UPI001C4BA148|nr:saxitoxin and tetrodotoxin-binding protein 1-like [Plectropomus leopardus]